MSQTTVPPQPGATTVEPSLRAVQTATAPEGLTETLILAPAEDTSIRPFRANVPDENVADLRRRLQATRWPDAETVADQSQGPQLAKLR